MATFDPNIIAIRLRTLGRRCLMILLGAGLLAAAWQAPPAHAAGRPTHPCAARARHHGSCPQRGKAHPAAGHWYADASGAYWYVDPAGRHWYFDPYYGALSYVDNGGHQWYVDLSGHLYYLDPASRLWYIDPSRRFWYADPYGRFWFYVDPDGHYGIVDLTGSSVAQNGYVAPSAATDSSDPRFSSDANGNWVTSMPADSGTIGVVDGCVSYIPSAGSGDSDVPEQGGSC
jgi:hypothetical protein